MTLEELDDRLPNGFHDAKLVSLSLDYVTRSATLHIGLHVGTPDSLDPEEYKIAILRVTGLCFCTVELPCPGEPFLPDGSPVNVSGYPEDPKSFEKVNESLTKINGLLAKCPPGAWCYRFFSHDWNSFIHIAGTSVELLWREAMDESR
jgi:hypothetical protein